MCVTIGRLSFSQPATTHLSVYQQGTITVSIHPETTIDGNDNDM